MTRLDLPGAGGQNLGRQIEPPEPERWLSVAALVEAALERPTEEQSAWLEEACGHDETLRAEALEMLVAVSEAEQDSFLEPPKDDLGRRASELTPEPTLEGQILALTGDNLSLSGAPTVIDLSAYRDNTDAQTLAISGNDLTISGSGSTVDITAATAVAALLDRVHELEDIAWRTVFVTSARLQGLALGSAAGADQQCQASPTPPA